MPEMKNRRTLRNLIISPRFQARYVLLLAGAGALLAAAQSAVFYVFTRENYATLVELSPMTDDVKLQLYRELHQILLYLGLGSLVFLALVCWLGLYVSHKAAGPLFHFGRVFRAIREGRLDERIRLRPRDDFQDVAREFNEMMDQLAEREPLKRAG